MSGPDSIFRYVVPRQEGGCAPCALAAGGRARRSGAAGRGRRADGAALDADSRKALAGLTTTTDECAEDVERAPGTPCASKRVTKAIAAFAGDVPPAAAPAGAGEAALLPTAPTPEAEAVRAAAAALGCDSESCVVTHPVFRRYVVERNVVPEAALDLELETRFKAPGPRDSKGLLSNYNIDETLRRWARVFPEFHPCPFAMMDFERNGDRFGQIELPDVLAGRAPVDLGPGFGVVRRPASCFGCVLNTDTSSGPGKHWVAVFVDARPGPGEPWSVEYFNSAGNPPPKPVVRWMERARAQLAEYRAALPASRDREAGRDVVSVPVTDVDHQESQTECGLYALYYIRRRLEGVPYPFFFEQLVPDDAMTAFRAHVFRSAK